MGEKYTSKEPRKMCLQLQRYLLRPGYTMRLNSTVELSWGQSYSVAGSKTEVLVISKAKT